MTADTVVAIDVGGTKVLSGLVARDGTVSRTIELPTPLERRRGRPGDLQRHGQ